MLAEFVEKLTELAQGAVETKVLPCPNNLDKSIVCYQGEVKEIDTPRQPPDVKSRLLTIEDFAKRYELETLATADDADKLRKCTPASGAVWFSLGQAGFYLDEPQRRSTVVVKLAHSAVWELVKSLKDLKVYDQKRLVRLLRHDLAGCVSEHLLAAFRTVDFSSLQRASSTIKHGSSSMDSDLQETVAGEKPQDFVISFSPFVNEELRGLKVTVRCTIDIDVTNGKFELQLLPDEVEIVEMEMRETIRRILTLHLPEGTPVLNGVGQTKGEGGME